MRKVAGWAASQLLARIPGPCPPSTAGSTKQFLWETSPICRVARKQAESCTQQRSIGSSSSSGVSRYLSDVLPPSVSQSPMLSRAFNSTANGSPHSLRGVSSQSAAVYLPVNTTGFLRTGIDSCHTAGPHMGTRCGASGRGFAYASLGSRMAAATQQPGSTRQAVKALQAWKVGGASMQSAGGQWRGFAAGAGKVGENPSVRRRAMMASAGNKSSSQALYLVALIVSMIGITYASVPLYRMFCQATGYGGTVAEGKTVEDKIRKREENPDAEVEAAALKREITVTFNADVNDGMPWKFQPTQRSVKVHPGQSTLAFFTAENTSPRVITGVSTYNVTPQQAGSYFNKIQCFCFEEQKLRPGEKIDMPVFFYVDPEFATDPRMKNVNHLTLSYTFFKVTDQTVEEDAAARAAVAGQQDPVLVPALSGV